MINTNRNTDDTYSRRSTYRNIDDTYKNTQTLHYTQLFVYVVSLQNRKSESRQKPHNFETAKLHIKNHRTAGPGSYEEHLH